MNGIWFFHILLLGSWGGCVAVEMILEFTSRKQLQKKLDISLMHPYIDYFVEIPLLLLVSLTGMLMLDVNRLYSLYLIKICLAIIPVCINILCVIPVVLRKRAAERNDEISMDRYTKFIYLAFATGLTFSAIRLGLGMFILGIIR
jgi:hypothetical protein